MSECREAFEAWYESVNGQKPSRRDPAWEGCYPDDYEWFSDQDQWNSWQAACAWNARPDVTVPVEVVEEIETCAAMKVPSDDPDFMHDFPWIDMQQRFDEDRVYWETLCIGEADLARRLLRRIKETDSALKGGGDAEE